MKCSLGISSFVGEISDLSHSIVFLSFFALISQENFLISPCYSLELCIQMGISFLFSFAFSFSSFLSCVRPPQTTIFPFCISSSWSLPPVQCYEPPSIVLQALSLSHLIPWICLSFPLYNCKGFDLVIPEWFSGFPTSFNLSLNSAINSSWCEPPSAPHLVFADCIELLHLQLQRI